MTYTVVGYWSDDGSPYCDTVEAESPEDAERAVHEAAYRTTDALRTVAVFEGALRREDTYDTISGPTQFGLGGAQ